MGLIEVTRCEVALLKVAHKPLEDLQTIPFQVQGRVGVFHTEH